ncbi:DMT family transporter [Ktedonosporobacter rubrisoli]|uniref:DMT family transporter n=1 Tax=Ktedonosporobacter rubrisoli TaxID=2509675 RepID=A0A4P6JKW0_KTERU|nr:DMT family transporter [Ktedonosporobacter rubrisoli]QBD75612.1 DMT family transporter [Ktedonosporobacter rubrisoli]
MLRERAIVISALAALLLAVSLWGLAPVANRYLITSALSVKHLVLMRFSISALLCIPLVLRIRKQGWGKREWLRALLCGLANILGYNLMITIAVQWLPAGMTGLLASTSPLWIALISWLFLREPPSRIELIGLALGLLGILILISWTVWRAEQREGLLLGMAMAIFALLMWAIYTLAVRPLSRKYGSPVGSGITTILGTLPLLVLWDPHVLPSFTQLSGPAWLAFALLALGSTVIGIMLWNFGVAHLRSTQAASFMNLLPIVSVIGGSLLLHEQITPVVIISSIIIITGIIVAQLPSLLSSSYKRTLRKQPSTAK